MSPTKLAVCGLLLFLGSATACVADPPRVVSAEPDDGDEQVDPKLAVLRVEFDQDMRTDRMSLCGIQQDEIAGKPRWKSPRVFECPIKLQPNRKYAWSVNCPSARNFQGTSGESAEIYPLRFKTTGGEGQPVSPPTLEERRAAIERLRTIVDQQYAYRDLRCREWDHVFAEHAPALAQATTWDEFARQTAKLLGAAADIHIAVRLPDGELLATYRRQVQSNFNPDLIQSQVPRLNRPNRTVASGKFDDGIGYVMIGNWSKAQDLEPVFQALEAFADARGLIVDVRPNSGGNERLAAEVAGCFVRQPAVYSRHVLRDPSKPDGFTPPRDRVIQPNGQRKPVTCPVAVLMGPVNMSSCESFLLMMRAAANVQLIGQQSYGSSGNPRPHEIGGGIQVFLPSWQDFLLDGTLLEGHGVMPDVNVPADVNGGRDAALDAALARLRAR